MNEDAFFDAFDDGKPKSRTYFVLVIYDVSDTKRRNKLSKVLGNYGSRVQESAFECYLTKGETAEIVKQALEVIDVSRDSFRLYRMNHNDVVDVHGVSGVTEERLFVLV
jgi:CRISPR-associated protein Cas2